MENKKILFLNFKNCININIFFLNHRITNLKHTKMKNIQTPIIQINYFKSTKLQNTKKKKKKNFRTCLVTIFSLIFCFQKQFSIFKTKKLVWQFKISRKQKLLLKLNLWRKLKTCKKLFSVFSFQRSIETRV